MSKNGADILAPIFIICLLLLCGAFSSQTIAIGRFLLNIWRIFTC